MSRVWGLLFSVDNNFVNRQIVSLNRCFNSNCINKYIESGSQLDPMAKKFYHSKNND